MLLRICLLVFFSTGLLGGLWIVQEYSSFNRQAAQMRVTELERCRGNLKAQVEAVTDFILFNRSQVEERIQENVKNRVYEAHAIASHIHETYQNEKSPEQLKKMVIEALRSIRFYRGKGYYFTTSLEGVSQLFTGKIEVEGTNILDMQDSGGAYVIQDLISLVREEGEGFYRYSWTKPQSKGNDFKKISFVKHFAPFDWFIGTGFYLDDMEQQVKAEVLERISTLHFDKNISIFAGQWDGLILVGPKAGENMLSEISGDGADVVAKLVEKAKSGGGFVTSVMPDPAGHRAVSQISYVRGVEPWQWYVGAAENMAEIEAPIEQARTAMLDRVKGSVARIVIVLICLLAVAWFYARRMSLQTKRNLHDISSFFEKSVDPSLPHDTVTYDFLEFQQLADSAKKVVDQRQQVFRELRANEKRYRALFDAASDVILISEKGVFVDCNQKALEMFGCEREQIIGLRPEDLSPEQQPDGKESKEMADEKTIAALRGQQQFFAWTGKRYDGTLFDAEVSLKSIELDNKTLILCIARDVTKRKHIEKQLLRQASAIEQAAEEVIIIDRHGVIEYVNPAFEAITGYGLEEVTGKDGDFFVADVDDPDPGTIAMWGAIDEGVSWRGRMKSTGKNGRLIVEEAIASPIVDSDGNRMGFVVIKRDMSEQVKVESMFRQTQKMEAIGTLAGGIAHDFNNILAAIFGFTEICLLEVDKDSPTRQKLEKILEAAGRARDLVKQILTFSRSADTPRQPVRLISIVKETVKLLTASLPSTIEIRANLLSEEAVMADPTGLHQVLMNLCTNAAHAMRESGGVMEIGLITVELDLDFARLHPGITAGQFIKLSVSDTGHGMEDEVKERLFDPFFTTKAENEGSGMGLAVVHGIVSGCGGTMIVSSELGQGSTFNVYFPVHVMPVAPKKDLPGMLPGGSETILLVDDEEFIVEIGKQMLSQLGYAVITKMDSTEALAFIKEQPDDVDLLITDFTMPKMTGLELTSEVRKILPSLPIILCTGFNADLSEDDIKAAGVDEFVLKPVVRDDLGMLVRKVLDAK